jgi:hypothetical protein
MSKLCCRRLPEYSFCFVPKVVSIANHTALVVAVFYVYNCNYVKCRENSRIFSCFFRDKLFFVFITTFGLTENQYSGILCKTLVLDDLFNEK